MGRNPPIWKGFEVTYDSNKKREGVVVSTNHGRTRTRREPISSRGSDEEDAKGKKRVGAKKLTNRDQHRERRVEVKNSKRFSPGEPQQKKKKKPTNPPQTENTKKNKNLPHR